LNFEPTTSVPKNLEFIKGMTFVIKVVHRSIAIKVDTKKTYRRESQT